MKITLTEDQFIDNFKKIRPDNFSYDALSTLFHYYKNLERDIEEELECDPIAICCDWCEFKSQDEATENYHLEDFSEIETKTTVLYLDDGSVIVNENF